MKHKISHTYIIENLITGRVYIGWTNSGKARWSRHKMIARKGPDSQEFSYVHRSIRKRGSEYFSFTLIEAYATDLEAIQGEIFWISEMKQYGIPLYNLTDGGDGISGYKFSDEQRKVRNQKIKNYWANNDHPLLGTHPSAETKLLFSGSQNPHHILNEEQALQIRVEYAHSGISQRELGRKYGVSRTTIQNIVKGKKWKHIAGVISENSGISTQNKIDAYWQDQNGSIITITIKCEHCNQDFLVERRENSTQTRLPRFCSWDCKKHHPR